jgi:tetratricopeptide (TPR) repeat protein
MADRYTYIPLIGLFIILAWGTGGILEKWVGIRPVLVTLWVFFLAGLSTLTWWQVGYWKNSFTLYRHAIAVTTANAVAYNNLGNVLTIQGELEQAEQHLREAVRLNSFNAVAHNNLGNVLVKLGRIEEGALHYKEALLIQPELAEASYNLERALRKLAKNKAGWQDE